MDDDRKVIYPLSFQKDISYQLLFERDGIQHYTTISNFSRLVGSELSNHEHAVYLYAYSTQELLDVHATDCCHAQRTKFTEDPRCRFSNIQKQLPVPFVLYADFESILKHVDEDVDTTQGVEVGCESSSQAFQ